MKNQRHQHKLSLRMKKAGGAGRSTDIKYDKSAFQKMAEVEKIMRYARPEARRGSLAKDEGVFMKT